MVTQTGVRASISSNVEALHEFLRRLDAERQALAEGIDVTVRVAELNEVKRLSEYVRDAINDPLGIILKAPSQGRARIKPPRQRRPVFASPSVGSMNSCGRSPVERDAHAPLRGEGRIVGSCLQPPTLSIAGHS